jgi:hypothetical protein
MFFDQVTPPSRRAVRSLRAYVLESPAGLSFRDQTMGRQGHGHHVIVIPAWAMIHPPPSGRLAHLESKEFPAKRLMRRAPQPTVPDELQNGAEQAAPAVLREWILVDCEPVMAEPLAEEHRLIRIENNRGFEHPRQARDLVLHLAQLHRDSRPPRPRPEAVHHDVRSVQVRDAGRRPVVREANVETDYAAGVSPLGQHRGREDAIHFLPR